MLRLTEKEMAKQLELLGQGMVCWGTGENSCREMGEAFAQQQNSIVFFFLDYETCTIEDLCYNLFQYK